MTSEEESNRNREALHELTTKYGGVSQSTGLFAIALGLIAIADAINHAVDEAKK